MQDVEMEVIEQEESFSQLKESLEGFGESPVHRKLLQRSDTYGKQKLQKISWSVTESLQFLTEQDLNPQPGTPNKTTMEKK